MMAGSLLETMGRQNFDQMAERLHESACRMSNIVEDGNHRDRAGIGSARFRD